MYTDYFGLAELPFSLTTDPRFIYWSKAHIKAKSYMDCALLMGDSSVIVTGEIGSGKTTLVDNAVSDLDPSIIIARIYQTRLSEVEFIQSVAVKLGIDAFGIQKVELLDLINRYLMKQYKQGKRVLLIVDEAQNLDQKMLEEVRLLSGLEINNKKVLNIILVGQPELNDTLDTPEMEQLLQRVRFRFHLTALDTDDIEPYITHRLAIAGLPNQSLFSADAYPIIHRYTGGIPRLINVLCDMALINAYAEELDRVNADLVKIAVAELRWVPYNERKIHKPQPEYSPDFEIPELPKKPPGLSRIVEGENVAYYPLDAPVIRLGRKKDNDIRIHGPEVSRYHAEITMQDNTATIKDNNSANGTLINGERIDEKELIDGDIITIGSQQFRYQENEK